MGGPQLSALLPGHCVIQLSGLAKAIEEVFGSVSEASLLPPNPFHQHDSLFPHLLPLLNLTEQRHEKPRPSEPSS